jgi:hypothetical protein
MSEKAYQQLVKKVRRDDWLVVIVLILALLTIVLYGCRPGL